MTPCEYCGTVHTQTDLCQPRLRVSRRRFLFLGLGAAAAAMLLMPAPANPFEWMQPPAGSFDYMQRLSAQPLVGSYVHIVGGTGSGQIRQITAYNRVAVDWETQPDQSSQWVLYGPELP